MKILLAVDESPCSNAAVDEVRRRPWPPGSEVRVVSVFESAPVIAMVEAWVPPEGYYEQMETAGKNRAELAVKNAECQLEDNAGKLSVSHEILCGLPKEEIVAAAKAWAADLIVVGSHGYTGWQRLWLGSVSHAIATHAECSVEIVRKLQQKEET